MHRYLRMQLALSGVALLGVLAPLTTGRCDEGESARKVVARYEKTYQKFVDDFCASKQSEERLGLVRKAGKEITDSGSIVPVSE